MDWLQNLDTTLFRVVNHSLSNRWCDAVMPYLSWNALFVPSVLVIAAMVFWRGGVRGRLYLVVLALLLALGEEFVTKTVKDVIGRPRPFVGLADVHLLVGMGGNERSMPSGHTTVWFAAAFITGVFYRGSWRFMVPIAALIGFSRVYLGVHYPGDVLAGVLLGAGYAAAGLWGVSTWWSWAGRRWFPLWHARLPVLVPLHGETLELRPLAASTLGPDLRAPGPEDGEIKGRMTSKSKPVEGGPSSLETELDLHWLRLGYLFLVVSLFGRLAYLASGTIQLTKDEAYQWLWSKHLALSYYSKPPLIALIQWTGTSLWGDTAFGVRFFSPVFAALLGWVFLRFMAREASAKLGFGLLLAVTAAPLMSLGTILMTIDPPLVLCWVLAMVLGWRAAQPDGTTRHWLAVGVAMALGFLAKYAAAYQWVCWALFFVLYPPARVHLKRPGPYLALLLALLATTPVLVWNAQHQWVTVDHVAFNAGVDRGWNFTLRFFWDFLFSQLGLLNPIFFVGALGALAGAWRARRERPLWLYLFCMGAPVFLGYLLFSFHKRVLPNWIAPAIIPMFCLMALYWESRWRNGWRWVKPVFIAGVVLGLAAVGVMHNTNVLRKIAGRPLPAEKDPLRRARAWPETAQVVETARQRLAREGTGAFIIADHYGMTAEFTFYLPAARAAASAGKPWVYPPATKAPENQFFFWPEYRYRETRRGQNAIFAAEFDPPRLADGWFWKWLGGETNLLATQDFPAPEIPPAIRNEFESVKDLGLHEVKFKDRILRRLRLYECRNLR